MLQPSPSSRNKDELAVLFGLALLPLHFFSFSNSGFLLYLLHVGVSVYDGTSDKSAHQSATT